MGEKCHKCGREAFDAKYCPVCNKPHCRRMDCLDWPDSCCSGCDPAKPNVPPPAKPGDTENNGGGSSGDQKPQPQTDGGGGNSGGQNAGQAEAEEGEDSSSETEGEGTEGGQGGEAEGEGQGESEPEPTYSVVITDAGGKRIRVIKEVRDMTKLGLKEAKDLVDAVSENPQTVASHLPMPVAQYLARKLTECGAIAGLTLDIPLPGKSEQEKEKEYEEDPTPREFHVFPTFTATDEEFYGYLRAQGLTNKQALAILEDGRFGKYAHLDLTCLFTPADKSIEVIDCNYLS